MAHGWLLYMIKLRLASVLVAGAFAVALSACGGEDPTTENPAAQQSSAPMSSPAGGLPVTLDAACPLVDTLLLPTLFKVTAVKLEEKKPAKGAGDVPTYSCDVLDGGELFLTVGFSVGPPSGTAQDNVLAALGGAVGEPVTGLGEAGAFGVDDGVGTVAGFNSVGGKAVVLFVHGDPSAKSRLTSVARSVASKI